MKILTPLILYIFFFVSTSHGGWWLISQQGNGSGSTPTYSYAGYPVDANGNPLAPSGTWQADGPAPNPSPVDRVYGRPETGISGTADAINLKIMADPLASNELACLYNGTTVIATVDISGAISAGSWTGFQELTVVGGQSLTFSSGDILYISGCFDDPTVGGYIGYDDGETADIYRDGTAWSGTPPSPASWTPDSSVRGLGAILRYVQQ